MSDYGVPSTGQMPLLAACAAERSLTLQLHTNPGLGCAAQTHQRPTCAQLNSRMARLPSHHLDESMHHKLDRESSSSRDQDERVQLWQIDLVRACAPHASTSPPVAGNLFLAVHQVISDQKQDALSPLGIDEVAFFGREHTVIRLQADTTTLLICCVSWNRSFASRPFSTEANTYILAKLKDDEQGCFAAVQLCQLIAPTAAAATKTAGHEEKVGTLLRRVSIFLGVVVFF